VLFNSVPFVAGFLPIVLAGYFVFSKISRNAPIAFLVISSLFFYGWWDPSNLLIIIPSILGNYVFGMFAGRTDKSDHPSPRRFFLFLGVSANLTALAYFKYYNFFVATLADAANIHVVLKTIVLPLGISFFTFQQIKFLVDRYTGRAAQPTFLYYFFLISFFPHVIAGPIVQYNDLLPQLEGKKVFRLRVRCVADGLTIFLLGLAKKLVLADQLGNYVAGPFHAASVGEHLTFFAAWSAALSYTLQLYFDFSGYSDMAIGLARMFGLRFPINFNSPYKADNIVEFWKRWHITLSTFLREYLYIPLGGNRHGDIRRYANLMATMLLGGLWHGAGWTFVAWGALHGAYLTIVHLWHRLCVTTQALRCPRAIARVITLLAVIIAWVLFRADSLSSANNIFRGMSGQYGALLPSQLIEILPFLSHIANGSGTVPNLGDGTVLGSVEMLAFIALGFAICLGTPNLYELSRRRRSLLLIPSFALTMQKLFFAAGSSEFLYFRF
jgi:alginate O-acetyltransferase complex protein AlgI